MHATADELVRAARPLDALAALQARVRQDAADPQARLFLFQLLAILGQWERADAQLAVCGTLDAGLMGLVASYRAALVAERERERVFGGERRAEIAGTAAPWARDLAQALFDGCAGKAGAGALRAAALEAAPAVSGQLDGEDFLWLADADSRLGPVLEVIEGERYAWVPLTEVQALRITSPQDLRDLVWLPAELQGHDGAFRPVWLPTRYAGTASCQDGALQMARRTEWEALADDQWRGLGQRVLVTDVCERGLLDVREIRFDTQAP